MNIKIIKERNPLADAFAKSVGSIESKVEIRKLSIVEELLQFMKREGINRSELAQRMGVPPSRITKMLSGDSNLTIDTLVRAGHAVGADLAQTFVPQGHRIRWIHYPSEQKSKTRISLEPSAVKKIPSAQTPQFVRSTPADRDAEDAA